MTLKVGELKRLLNDHKKVQPPPLYDNTMSAPILIDKHNGYAFQDGDEFTYWDN